jgi:hypothetical protein
VKDGALRREVIAGQVRDVLADRLELAGHGAAAAEQRLVPAPVILMALDGVPGRPRRRRLPADHAEIMRLSRPILEGLRAAAARAKRQGLAMPEPKALPIVPRETSRRQPPR